MFPPDVRLYEYFICIHDAVLAADSGLPRQFQEVERLPDEDKHVVKTLLDAFLTKRHLQTLVHGPAKEG